MNDIFEELKSRVFAKADPRIRGIISQLEQVFRELPSALPPGAFERLAPVLRALCENGEAFFGRTSTYTLLARHAADGSHLPSLDINWGYFDSVSPEEFKATLTHEMIHFAFESPQTSQATTRLFDSPVLQDLAWHAATNPKARGQSSFDFAKLGVMEALANDVVMRTTSRSAYEGVYGAGLIEFLAGFGRAVRRNLPGGTARAAFSNFNSVVWGAAGMMPAGVWKHDAELAKTFNQKVGKEIKKQISGRNGKVRRSKDQAGRYLDDGILEVRACLFRPCRCGLSRILGEP